jgi:hypothetical protein
MLEAGRLTRHPGHFAEQYRTNVADVRGTSVAHVLKDLGHLDEAPPAGRQCAWPQAPPPREPSGRPRPGARTTSGSWALLASRFSARLSAAGVRTSPGGV